MSARQFPLISAATPLAELNEAEIGGKAWNLHRLRAAGYDVPHWWVVPSRIFHTALGDGSATIDAMVAGIDFSSQPAIEAAASEIRAMVLHTEIPAPLLRQLAGVLEVSGGDQRFAVRSSVSGEDSAANSFAGQMDTLLNVRPGDVAGAIQEVWASAYSARSLLYRAHRELDLTGISPAVIVQRMQASVAAGVMFTRDPETRRETCIISAAHGLCEGVTGDAVETDTYRYDANGGIDARITAKATRMVSLAAGGVGTTTVPHGMQRTPVLDDRQVAELGGIGRRLEQIFGAPQDIEWAIDRDGRIFLLQARPIVFANRPPARERSVVWDNSNIVESYPGITLPLTFSFARKAYETAFRSYISGFFPFRRSLIDRLAVFDRMLGLIHGRIYYNLPSWYAMLSLLPHSKGHRAAWDQMVGVAQTAAFGQIGMSRLDRLCASGLMAWRLLTVRWTARRFFRGFDGVYRRYAQMDLAVADEFALSGIYHGISDDLAGKWRLTLDNDFCAMTYYACLKWLCRRWGPDGIHGLHNDLLGGRSAIESVAPIRSLDRLQHLFHGRPHFRALLGETHNRTIWQRIQREDKFAELKAALDEHLAAFGDRSTEELKLETESFRERPEELIELIRQHIPAGGPGEAAAEPGSHVDGEAERVMGRHLRNPVKRAVFALVLRGTRTAIANRENMRFARSRLFGLARRIFRRMGEVLAAAGVLASADDIHLLTVDEVFDYVHGMTVTRDLAALAQLRRQEYADFEQIQPPDRIETSGLPYSFDFHAIQSELAVGNSIDGVGCGSGSAQGTARVITDPRNAGPVDGCILIARSTDPGWVFLMTSAKGLVVEKGSVLSHTAIVGRELGIPTIVGATDATRRIADGDRVFMDGGNGRLRWQSVPAADEDRGRHAA